MHGILDAIMNVYCCGAAGTSPQSVICTAALGLPLPEPWHVSVCGMHARTHQRLELLDNVHPFHDLAKHHVLAVQPRCRRLGHVSFNACKTEPHEGDEELRAVGVGAGVGHGQQPGRRVLVHKVLVSKLASVDGLATDARPVREVAALKGVIVSTYRTAAPEP